MTSNGDRQAVETIKTPPLILHISSDYLDPIRTPRTTDAVVRLVDRMTDHPQIVVSLLRVADPRHCEWHDLGEVEGRRLIVYRYFAPPFGFAMATCQAIVARRIARFLMSEGLRPDIIHTHRFTFEGIAGWKLAKRFGAAHFASMRGEVDRKVFRAKPTYRPLFRRMARDIARVFHVSAWYGEGFALHTGIDPEKTGYLPNIVYNARPSIPVVDAEPVIVSPMSLRGIDKKGLPDLLAAFALARQRLPGISLEIVGEGPDEAVARVHQLIEANGLSDVAELRPFMPHDKMLSRLSKALVMALPSRQETFGMVYSEALFAGTPILYSLGSGIDGYLDGLEVGVGIRPGEIEEIADGLVKLVTDNARYREAISASAPILNDRLGPDAALARYREAISEAGASVRARRRGDDAGR